MSQKIKLNRKGFETRAYKNSIDTSFTQLIPPPLPIEETATVEDFFDLYKTLFYDIPSEGESSSHRFLVERSLEYIGETEQKDQDIQILLDEITQLREELLSTQKELRDVQNSGSFSFPENGSSIIQEGTQITSQPFSLGNSNIN